jgi:hypothetical protein
METVGQFYEVEVAADYIKGRFVVFNDRRETTKSLAGATVSGLVVIGIEQPVSRDAYKKGKKRSNEAS